MKTSFAMTISACREKIIFRCDVAYIFRRGEGKGVYGGAQQITEVQKQMLLIKYTSKA